MEHLEERLKDLELSCHYYKHADNQELKDGWLKGINAVRGQLIEIGVEEQYVDEFINNCIEVNIG